MIKYIITILYKWIVAEKEEDKKVEQEKSNDEYNDIVCGLSCTYHINKTVSIDIILNQILKFEDKQAEQFSQFLYHITQPSFRQTILDNIKTHSNTPEEVLFYQNIIFNIAMMELNQKSKDQLYKKDTEPVIRPLAVFSASN